MVPAIVGVALIGGGCLTGWRSHAMVGPSHFTDPHVAPGLDSVVESLRQEGRQAHFHDAVRNRVHVVFDPHVRHV